MRRPSMRISGLIAIGLLGTGGLVNAQDDVKEAVEVTAFTSDFAWSHQPDVGERTTLANGVERVAGQAWQFRSIESSDPRFAGTYTLTATWDAYPGVSLVVGTNRIETADGAWQQQADYWHTWDPQPGDTAQLVLVGEGAYEGLIAIVDETWRPDGTDIAIRIEGFIVDGDLPPDPEPWSAR